MSGDFAKESDMMSTSDTTVAKAPRQVVIMREYDAPRALVFEAWSKAEHLKHWFAPKGFDVPTCEIDFRPGGDFTLCMRAPGGKEYWSKGTVREIAVPERIVLESALLDDEGKPRFEDRNVVSFTERDGRTLVIVTASVTKLYDPTATDALDGMEQGWRETLDRLESYLGTVS
jgi:uncharacterized protein YndB with AHSA1/START domain